MAIKHFSTDFYVYALFRENGVPFYIGKGRGSRWTFHEWEARKGAKGHKQAIIRGILTRGVEVIRVKLHEGLTEAVAHTYEVALIAAIGRYPIGPLVNLTDGGDGLTGLRHTAEALAKMSAAKLGRKLSAESIAKRSAAQRGRVVSQEIRERISAAQKGKPRKKLTPEAIAKRSAKVRGQKRSAETRSKMVAAQRRLASMKRRSEMASTPDLFDWVISDGSIVTKPD